TLLYLQVEGVIDELLYKEEHTMRARMANGVCLTCTRQAGNYFEATVQVRSSGRRLSDAEFKVLRASLDVVIENLSDDPMFFITSEGAVTGGYDVVLGSKGLARSWGRHMASNFGGHISESNSTVGRKDGIDVTRLTLLYRKPGYDLGDVVKWKDYFWRPASWSKDGAVMERIDRRERTGATWRDLEHSKVVCQMKDFVSVELITEDSSVGEFLSPESWQMTPVRLPWDYKGDKKLLLARVDDEWMALQHLGIDASRSDEFQLKED
ncbi:MAG: NMD3-related protein, partial [Euryarchaeota archaeon]